MLTENITVVGVHTVKPVGVQAHEGSLYMSAWDQIYGFMHMRTIHLYNNPGSKEWLETLKSSLGRALAHFSPLAGRLRWVAGPRRRLEINCNGEGVKLVEAECDGEMIGFRSLETDKPKWLVPEVDCKDLTDGVPAMLVQVTKFRCGGVALGVSMSHAVADGKSAFHFFMEWARLARGEPLKEAPNLDRTVFIGIERSNKARRLSFSDHIEFQKPTLLLGKKDSIDELKKETVRIVLPLTKAQIDKLKNVTNSNVNDNGGGVSSGFSRYEVLATHIWRCATKARGHEYEQPTSLIFSMDVRNRIHKISLPKRYFGNTIIIMRVKSYAGDLISNPIGNTCGKLREAMNNVDEDYIWSNYELLHEKDNFSFYLNEENPFQVNPNFKVIDWLKLPMNEMDFGWGSKIDTLGIFSDIDGTSYLLPSPKDDGSIVIVLCLQVAYADKFKQYFYDDI